MGQRRRAPLPSNSLQGPVPVFQLPTMAASGGGGLARLPAANTTQTSMGQAHAPFTLPTTESSGARSQTLSSSISSKLTATTTTTDTDTSLGTAVHVQHTAVAPTSPSKRASSSVHHRELPGGLSSLDPQPLLAVAVPSASNTALHLKNVPDELNNKTFLSAHLGKFGKIKALKCFPEKRYATVEYYLRVCVYISRTTHAMMPQWHWQSF